MEPLLLNEKQTAVLLNISVSKLQKSRAKGSQLISQGRVPPFVKVDGKVLYVREEVVTFVNGLTRLAEGGRAFKYTEVTIKEEPVVEEHSSTIELSPSESVIPDDLMAMCDFLN
ncbi:hypothetical protein QWY77_01715 [Thalassotalea ponticola]|uniref:hypothetical protein n=1 Tax=Thalassotalea ponticola TaxID=1523392 RepID=UPI0025B3018C|nr:hypothetical protein [Thalassotalea ponticola]MDN3651501.1 hypothetical protein [Thalassotalea ponticola]